MAGFVIQFINNKAADFNLIALILKHSLEVLYHGGENHRGVAFDLHGVTICRATLCCDGGTHRDEILLVNFRQRKVQAQCICYHRQQAGEAFRQDILHKVTDEAHVPQSVHRAIERLYHAGKDSASIAKRVCKQVVNRITDGIDNCMHALGSAFIIDNGFKTRFIRHCALAQSFDDRNQNIRINALEDA